MVEDCFGWYDNWIGRLVIKKYFGNRHNWQMFCAIHDRIALELLCKGTKVA